MSTTTQPQTRPLIFVRTREDGDLIRHIVNEDVTYCGIATTLAAPTRNSELTMCEHCVDGLLAQEGFDDAPVS